jgi:uncharacterized protein (DUF2267 family)
MRYEQFLGRVQERARLGSREEAVRASAATLQTLAERLDQGEAKDLASQLPREFHTCFDVSQHGVRISLEDFFLNVASREEADLPTAVYHARTVIEVLQEAVSPGEIADVRAQLPPDWAILFGAGSTGKLRRPATVSAQSGHNREIQNRSHMKEINEEQDIDPRAYRPMTTRSRRGQSLRVRTGRQSTRNKRQQQGRGTTAGSQRTRNRRRRTTTTARRRSRAGRGR